MTSVDGREDGRSLKPSAVRFAPLAVLAFAAAAVFASGLHRYLSIGKIEEHRETLQAFVDARRGQAILLYGLVYVGAVALSIPGAVFLTILGGFLFGWLLGGALAVVSATAGAVLIFLIARTSLGDLLLARAGPRLQGLAAGFRQDAFSYLLFLRVLPVMPFWLTNLASALFGVPLRTFALATLIGIVPATFTFATAGAGLDSIIAAQRQAEIRCEAQGGADCRADFHWKALVTPKVLAAFAALGALSLLPVLLRRRAGHRPTGAA